MYCEIIVHAKATWPSVRESDSKSVKGVLYAAPSSISVLVIPATLENELSKTLFLQSLQMPGGTNRTIVTFKKNSSRNVKTNAVCWNRNVLCKLKWKTWKEWQGQEKTMIKLIDPYQTDGSSMDPKKNKTKQKQKQKQKQMINYWKWFSNSCLSRFTTRVHPAIFKPGKIKVKD